VQGEVLRVGWEQFFLSYCAAKSNNPDIVIFCGAGKMPAKCVLDLLPAAGQARQTFGTFTNKCT
jgi:hypothetical protein